jgi:hypothetical protein
MRVPARTRALAVLAASASLLALPLAGPSSAVVKQPGTCTKLTTKTVGSTLTATLTGCTPLAATGGKGTGKFKSQSGSSGNLNITITWANHKGTTKGTIHFANNPAGRGKCPVGTTRTKITGKVTGGTGAAVKTIKAKQPITGSVCVGAKITLEPGTALKF